MTLKYQMTKYYAFLLTYVHQIKMRLIWLEYQYWVFAVQLYMSCIVSLIKANVLYVAHSFGPNY